MSYILGEDRGQAALLPAAIEDYVVADAPVRVIDAFVDGLDVIGLGFGRSVPAATGRPPYDPRDLLKLYLYGYLNEVRSSRRLERECSRNIEAMWLLRRLAPDFKTIADFRRDNGAAIVGAGRGFVLFCQDQGLFTARLVALDGSKFRAAASAKRVIGRREIAEEAARLDRRIADYLAGLDETDAREAIRLITTARSAGLMPQGLRDFRNAARVAVAAQTMAFKNQTLAANAVCPLTRVQLTADNCAVDHDSPSFDQLLFDFSQQHDVNPLLVQVGSIGGVRAVINDAANMEQGWQGWQPQQ